MALPRLGRATKGVIPFASHASMAACGLCFRLQQLNLRLRHGNRGKNRMGRALAPTEITRSRLRFTIAKPGTADLSKGYDKTAALAPI